ncbi:MAG: adenylyl-sulfate kinase [Alphaproteobacteria bacterium]|nr:adenylyl-sulfate kinase [Alphaproteobacteria bacterium]
MSEPLHLPLRIVIVGHVDHGKSTLIGRMLNDTGALPESKVRELEAAAKGRGVPFEWSFLLDSFQAERDQAITIDTTQIRFKHGVREFVIIDAPGHKEFLKNMISGAAAADAAVLIVDAAEGVREQTKRHAYLLHLLGLKQVVVAINKMDRINFDHGKFEALVQELKEYLHTLGVRPTAFIPIAARDGDNLANASTRMDWYKGKTLLDQLHVFERFGAPVALPLRFPVQDVYRVDEKRILVGRIESGVLRKGDKVLFSPTNETATVTDIVSWPDRHDKAFELKAGEVFGVTLDQPIFVERGHIGSHAEHAPMLTNVFRTSLFWLSKNPLRVGNSYKVRFGTTETAVTVQSIDKVVDTDDLKQTEQAKEVVKNAVAEVTLRAGQLIAVDSYSDNHKTGRFVLVEGADIVGGGLISMEGYADQRRLMQPKSENIYAVDHLTDADARAQKLGHYGGVFWFTGLSGAGKSTLAMLAEKALFERGYHAYVLDGDNVRHGLNKDLGFSPDDRAENIRRVGEVSALMADAGIVCITAFISPYRADRDRARSASPRHFNEIYIKANIETCEKRDPKGLYVKARKGLITEFTGIDSPYEAPENPEMVVDTEVNSVEVCVKQIVDYIEAAVSLKKKRENIIAA